MLLARNIVGALYHKL